MKSNGYYNDKVIAKFAEALKKAREEISAMLLRGEKPLAKFSASNTKMGAVASVSLLPFITCPSICGTTCGGKCYAAKLANLRKNVLMAYAWNTALYQLCPEEFFAQINHYMRGVRYFRYHVSGDIVNKLYFAEMVNSARNNPKTEILVFTKRFNIVNAWIAENGAIPENMHILFSGWNNMSPNNPHNMPETTVYKDASEIRDNWTLCGGNCFECAINCAGCWNAKRGETIAFKLH